MRFVTGIVLVLAAVGGCTSTPIKPVDPGNRFTSRPPVDLKSIDPPTRFNAAAAAPLEVSTNADEVLLHGTTAVVPIHGSKPTVSSGEEIRLIDTRTNKVREVIKPTYPQPRIGTVIALPTLTSVQGRPTVLAPFLGEAPGQGTTPGRPLVEVVSIDPENGKTDWRTEIPIEGWTGTGRSSGVEVSFAGVADGVGVDRIVDPSLSARRGDTYALDLSSRKVRWSMRGFEARAVAAGMVTGQQSGTGQTPKVQVRGIDAQTGSWLWSITKGGGRLVPLVTGACHGVVYGRTANGPVVLDGRTGTDRETQPGVAPSVVNSSMAIGPWPGGGLGSSSYPVIG
ncbi:hypothetical protein AB0L65_45095 [Nonomuraea sp. NPDC052116]|uniref:hypothetical protein n=1 Tax=Nonomuraea sp. NPDC052116 TaxID=3155665 RepID=UPI003425836A